MISYEIKKIMCLRYYVFMFTFIGNYLNNISRSLYHKFDIKSLRKLKMLTIVGTYLIFFFNFSHRHHRHHSRHKHNEREIVPKDDLQIDDNLDEFLQDDLTSMI